MPEGYIPPCRQGPIPAIALLRSNLKSASEAEIAKPWPTASALSSIRSHKRPILHRQSSSMRSTSVFDSTIPYDLRFFQTLDRFVQREPWYKGIES